MSLSLPTVDDIPPEYYLISQQIVAALIKDLPPIPDPYDFVDDFVDHAVTPQKFRAAISKCRKRLRLSPFAKTSFPDSSNVALSENLELRSNKKIRLFSIEELEVSSGDGISEYMIKTVLNEHKCGKTMFVVFTSVRDETERFPSLSSMQIHCENMPDRRSVMRLPSYMNINMVYLNYVDSVPKDLLLEKRSFYLVFNTIFGAVHRIPLDKQRITFLPKHTHPVCSECARIQDLCNGAKLAKL